MGVVFPERHGSLTGTWRVSDVHITNNSFNGGVLMQKHSATMDTKSKYTEYYGSGRMALKSDIVAAPISSL